MNADPSDPAQPPPPPDLAQVFGEMGGPPAIWNFGLLTVAGTVEGGQHMGAPAAAPGEPVESREGDIAAEQTLAAMSGFAEPDWFAEALERARSRVVFLVGEQGSGRRTAALNLLQRHTGSFALRAVDSDVELATWTLGGSGARGYLIDGLLETRTLALTSIGLDNLRRQLDRAEACLVIVLQQTTQVLAHLKGVLHVDPIRAASPSARAVLDAKLATALPDPARRRPVLAGLPAGFLDETLRRDPRPSQVVELVSEIVRVADGATDAAAISQYLSLYATDHAPELLDSVRDSPDDLALLLATCVFEHFDHTVIEEEARRLLEVAAGRLDAAPPEADTTTPAENPGFVFLRSRRERLAAIGADRGPREVRANSAYSYAVEPVAFTRHLQGRAVLDHVWREHREAGELLVEWLRQTPDTQRRADRAGFILGQFAQWSSGYRALAPLEQLAASERPGDWRMAARAFGAASADPVLATAVKNRLRGWSRAASESLRCTAALTCATEFGLARPEVALALLHTTVTARDDGSDAVESAVRRALLSLFAEPALRPRVVEALLQWSRPPGPARRTACAAVAQLLKTAATTREPGEWWSTHLLSGDAPPGAELIRSALMEPTSFDTARAAFLEWQRRAAADPRRAPVVERLTEALAPHLRGGVLRLFTDLERAAPAPGAERAGLALAQWRGAGTPQRGH
ncbi:hypothetical protein [Streptomyces hiroshimensis]|uniref:Uncharacterized protein n=1 Tax=Streptomyces hiroshimensis TaxID=66424 RepID=A0ABQ2Y5Z8_9ACTN|nr:hypothetical protein [Streptomyces hiroshimensis]GGX65524.1 hypothetical protein GCM10010324_08170 [Streptomyces hiroshimensis]